MQDRPSTLSDGKTPPAPRDGLAGLRENWRPDAVSGFLVFLVALPLCLGISMASGFPPFAGVLTAIVGGLVVTPLMGARVSIKGPAAGLIVIAIGAVEELGRGNAARGYRLALAAIVVAGVLQVLFGLARAGKLADFFPASAVHGMLAAIGIIIAAKQVHVALGVRPHAREPLGLLAEIPRSLAHANVEIAAIGAVSLVILFGWPALAPRLARYLPGPMLVLFVGVAMSEHFDLEHEHRVRSLFGAFDELGPGFLVAVPSDLLSVVTRPDFSALATVSSAKYVMMFALVGSLESLLSAKAVDQLDPYKRHSSFDRDLLATGAGNVLAGMLGGLPMITEIVRSSANVNNGGRTRWANFFHGLFLLAFIALLPGLVHKVPLAALAAMLIYTGYRLAAPREFAKTYRLGPEQLAVFVTTIVATLATDLLVGIATGVALKLVLHVARGVRPARLFAAAVVVRDRGDAVVVELGDAAVFSNWLGIKSRLAAIQAGRTIIVDCTRATLVDHTVMEHLHAQARARAEAGGHLELVGLDRHLASAAHPLAARRLARGADLAPP